MNTHTINAQGKKIGRIATEAASVLIGKNTVNFAPNKAGDINVSITNASKIDVTERKADQKMYKRYSGYPGGLKEESMKKLISRKGYSEIVRKAVKGMLPKNKLQPVRMKRLSISE